MTEDPKERWMNLTPLTIPFKYQRTKLWFGNMNEGKCDCGGEAYLILTVKNPHAEYMRPKWCIQCFIKLVLPDSSAIERLSCLQGLRHLKKEYPEKCPIELPA